MPPWDYLTRWRIKPLDGDDKWTIVGESGETTGLEIEGQKKAQREADELNHTEHMAMLQKGL